MILQILVFKLYSTETYQNLGIRWLKGNMASASPEKVECINCLIFEWKQPQQADLKRCTGCRMVWYCSKECQKEHWINNHKELCKNLSKKKVFLNSVHDEDTCNVCRNVSSISVSDMTNPSNPVLPCIMTNSSIRLMMPRNKPMAEMAEIAGQFNTKVEATITIIMRILVKMKLTNNILWQHLWTSRFVDAWYNNLWDARNCVQWYSSQRKKPGPLQGQLVMDMTSDIDIYNTMAEIDEMRQLLPIETNPSEFKPWDTIKLLTTFLREGTYNIGRFVADCLGLEGLPQEIERARLTFDKFNKVWENLLNLLSLRLVPFTTLVVEGLCYGNPVQQCYMCQKDIIVKDAVIVMNDPFLLRSAQILIFGQDLAYCLCSSKNCRERWSAYSTEMILYKKYANLFADYGAEICDYCGSLNHEVRGHRCAGCKTKIYCGVECQAKDTVHRMFCEKKGKRKTKRRQNIRRERNFL